MPKLPKLNVKGIADAIKRTQPPTPESKVDNKSVEKVNVPKESSRKSLNLSKLKPKTKGATKVMSTKPKNKGTYQIYNRGVTLSLIDHLALGGLLPEVAVDKIETLMNDEREKYIRADSQSRMVNILILEEDDLVGTCLDASIEHAKDATEIGLFTQRCAYNLRNFGAPGSLFNVNHPMSLKYGEPNHQILLLANNATLDTLESKFDVNDPNPLKFRLGVMHIPETRLEPLPMRVPEQSVGHAIKDLKSLLLKSADQRLYNEDDKFFDFSQEETESLWND